MPMLPKVANKVVQLTQDPESDAGDLAKLIQSDQPLAAHVMRIANSALYSPNSTMVSLQQAITRLGMQIISEIALAASINSKIFNAPGYTDTIDCQLKFSLHAGLWAKEIARSCRRNVEASFLAGLLHDIGRPVAVQTLIELASIHKISASKEDVLAIAHHYHQIISAEVVRQWEMPAIVCDVVNNIGDYQKAGKAKEQTMIVIAGSKVALCCGEYGERCDPKALYQDPVFADLNLYPDDLTALLEKRDRVKETLETMAS